MSANDAQRSAKKARRAARLWALAGWLALRAAFVAAQPDPASSAFLTVTETVSAAQESFNNQTRHTRQVEIVGMTVLLDPATPKNSLFATYDNQADIKSLTIYADTVVLRGRLRLPQTTVRIVAKNIIFDNPGSETNGTEIVTTPLSLTQRPTPAGAGLDGAAGLRAGDVYLFWHECQLSPSVGEGANLKGGDGQPAGLGRDGANGASMAVYDGSLDLPSTNAYPANTVWLWRLSGLSDQQPMFGQNAWPGNGENAVAAGRPGNGGAGGNLYVNHQPDFSANMQGGAGGQPGAITHGGAAGQPPVDAAHVQYVEGLPGNHYVTREQHTAQAGADASPPGAVLPIGLSGRSNVDENEPYFHPHVLRAINAYTAAVLATDDVLLTRQILGTYLDLYSLYKQTPNWTALPAADQQQAEAIRAEMEARLTQGPRNAARNWTQYR